MVPSVPTVSGIKPAPELPTKNEGETSPLRKPELATKPLMTPSAPPRVIAEPDFQKPQHMLSAAVLANPRSRQSLQVLKQLTPADQIEQLCNLEAMEQIGSWRKELKPDRVVSYALKYPKLSGNIFIADGAAVHSKYDWYRLRFKCSLSATRERVIAFEFLLGETIARDLWGEYSLPDEDTVSEE